ncbi:MAG: hypothetical protein ABTQ28_17270, partial [Thauera sp.]
MATTPPRLAPRVASTPRWRFTGAPQSRTMRAGQQRRSFASAVRAAALHNALRIRPPGNGHPSSPGGIPHRGGFDHRENSMNRRNFLRAGTLAAGLALPALARAQA